MARLPASAALIAATLAATLALAGCNQTSTAVTAPAPNSSAIPGVTPSSFHLPEGSGCSGDVARFKAIIDNDLSTGHTTDGVHKRMTADLTRAAETCSAGRSGEASAMVRSVRTKYGYPAS